MATLDEIRGTNRNGEIVGWQTADEAAERYARTPVAGAEIANDPRAAGRQFHIGDGIWISRCHDPECDVYVLSYGSLPGHAYQIGIGWHEYEDHDMPVVGINVAMLPA